MADCRIWPHISHHPICMGQGKIVCRLIVCGVHKHMHKRYVHTYAYRNSVYTYTCTYIHIRTMYVSFSHGMNVVYFPSQESFDFTSHHCIGSQCHPSNHKVHIRTHIPIVN